MITQEELKEILNYNPDTGIFTWIKSDRYGWVGKSPKMRTGRRYIEILAKGKLYKAHRLAWLYVYGEFPQNELDHINNNTEDNRISNLREATRFENTRNTRTPSTNKSGYKGVYFNEVNNRWVAQISCNGIQYYLGSFCVKEQAAEAVRAKREELHKEFANHG